MTAFASLEPVPSPLENDWRHAAGIDWLAVERISAVPHPPRFLVHSALGLALSGEGGLTSLLQLGEGVAVGATGATTPLKHCCAPPDSTARCVCEPLAETVEGDLSTADGEEPIATSGTGAADTEDSEAQSDAEVDEDVTGSKQRQEHARQERQRTSLAYKACRQNEGVGHMRRSQRGTLPDDDGAREVAGGDLRKLERHAVMATGRGVLAGFWLTLNKGCGIEANWRYKGASVAAAELAGSPAECQERCAGTSACEAYDFHSLSRRCTLLASGAARAADPVSIGGTCARNMMQYAYTEQDTCEDAPWGGVLTRHQTRLSSDAGGRLAAVGTHEVLCPSDKLLKGFRWTTAGTPDKIRIDFTCQTGPSLAMATPDVSIHSFGSGGAANVHGLASDGNHFQCPKGTALKGFHFASSGAGTYQCQSLLARITPCDVQGCLDRCREQYKAAAKPATGHDGAAYLYPGSGLGLKCAEGCADMTQAASGKLGEDRFCSRANGSPRYQHRPCPDGVATDADGVREAVRFGCDWWSQGGH